MNEIPKNDHNINDRTSVFPVSVVKIDKLKVHNCQREHTKSSAGQQSIQLLNYDYDYCCCQTFTSVKVGV